MAVAADDDVVVHGDAERPCRVDDHLRHVDVGARRGRIAGGMVVDEEFSRLSNCNIIIIFTSVCGWDLQPGLQIRSVFGLHCRSSIGMAEPFASRHLTLFLWSHASSS